MLLVILLRQGVVVLLTRHRYINASQGGLDSFNLPSNVKYPTSGIIILQTSFFKNFYSLVDKVPLKGNKLLENIREIYHCQGHPHKQDNPCHCATTASASILHTHHMVPTTGKFTVPESLANTFLCNFKRRFGHLQSKIPTKHNIQCPYYPAKSVYCIIRFHKQIAAIHKI